MLEIEEMVEVVDTLNDKIMGEDWVQNLGHCFVLQYSTYYAQILFNDIVMWCSENDEREYNEDKDEFEPLLKYIKKVFTYKLQEIYQLNDLINA